MIRAATIAARKVFNMHSCHQLHNEALTAGSLDVLLLKGSLDVLLSGLDLEPEGMELSRDRKGQSGTCCSAIWIKEATTLICLRRDSSQFA